MLVTVPIVSSRMDKVDVKLRHLFLKHGTSSLLVAVAGLHSCGLQEVTDCTLSVQPAGVSLHAYPSTYINDRGVLAVVAAGSD